MPNSFNNGSANRPAAKPPAPTPSNSLEELIQEAEDLRRMHQEFGNRLGRLLSALKQQRKHSRVFRQAVQSLQQLRLDG